MKFRQYETSDKTLVAIVTKIQNKWHIAWSNGQRDVLPTLKKAEELIFQYLKDFI